MFRLKQTSKRSSARRGVIKTDHGDIQTPFFMTIATRGAVKNIASHVIKDMGAQIVLSNTYHLYLRPGMDIMKKAKGLHNFMAWSKPILTDSGGYQVFSLAKMRKITEEGVWFTSDRDGSKHLLTPEKAIDIQMTIGSDMMMVLDECPPWPCSQRDVLSAVERTTRWAQRSKKYFDKKKKKGSKQFLFGIAQGGTYKKLRAKSITDLVDIDFDGYALGGLAVGEPRKKMFTVLDQFVEMLPIKKPRYLMGVGYPEELLYAVRKGIDMFDCVIPTRHARHGQLFIFTSRAKTWAQKDFYKKIIITNSEFKNDHTPIDKKCGCFVCQNYSRAYIRHLLNIKEALGTHLATVHNVYFYLELMRMMRQSIKEGRI